MTKYTFLANFPATCGCGTFCDWVEVTAKTPKTAERLARLEASRKIKLSLIEETKDTSDPCSICKKPFKTCGHF